MPLRLKAGTRLFSAVCTTELITITAPGEDVDVTIGGAPPLLSADDRDGSGSPAAGYDGGTAMGKRYVNADATLELLCIKPGDGMPADGGVVMVVKDAKPLPASD